MSNKISFPPLKEGRKDKLKFKFKPKLAQVQTKAKGKASSKGTIKHGG
jgi:hypothetical protein